MEGPKFPMVHLYLVCCPSSIDGFGVRKSCRLNHFCSLNYCEEHDTLWAQLIGVNGVLQSLKIPQYEPVEKSVWSQCNCFSCFIKFVVGGGGQVRF